MLPLGKPGGGAPLRSDSGSLKAAIGLDPEIQFQKRHREQVHNVIMPVSTTTMIFIFLYVLYKFLFLAIFFSCVKVIIRNTVHTLYTPVLIGVQCLFWIYPNTLTPFFQRCSQFL